MEPYNRPQQSVINPHFIEEEWIKLVFMLSDTQHWVNELTRDVVFLVPLNDRKKVFRKTYNLTVTTLAHILERHYYKIARYPGTGKFTIPVIEILHHIREGFHKPAVPVLGTLTFQRQVDTGCIIGFDRTGQQTTVITIISDGGGQIKTAYPGPPFL